MNLQKLKNKVKYLFKKLPFKKKRKRVHKATKGEQIVENYLIKHNIEYITEYQIKISKKINKSGKAYLDFYLPKLKAIIEYNGIQHYIPQEKFGGEKKFYNYQVPRDNYIKKYCKNKGIKLIEVRYDEPDVEKFLNNEIQILSN